MPAGELDERDLIRLCEGAGLFPVNLLFHAEIRPLEPRRWETFVNLAGNTMIPTLAEARRNS
jgi:hypothetical protein